MRKIVLQLSNDVEIIIGNSHYNSNINSYEELGN